MIRTDSSVFCRDFVIHPDGDITLWRVFSELNVGVQLPLSPTKLVLNPPVWLISLWLIEEETDRRVYPAVARWIAPNDSQILRETKFEIDFGNEDRFMYRLQIMELDFVGVGHYEYHIETLDDTGWGELTRNNLFITNDVNQ